MPPKKKTKAQSKRLLSDWETNPENLAAFVDYVRSIGLGPTVPAADAEQDLVRPAKRVKLSRGVVTPSDAICIDQHTVALPARKTAALPKDFSLFKQNIGDYVDVWVANAKPRREPEERGHGDWYLHLAPDKNSNYSNKTRSAHICYLLKTRVISQRLSVMARVARENAFDPGLKGYVWTAVDIAIRQEGSSAKIDVTFRLMWNTSTDVLQPKVQQALKSHVLTKYYPDLLPQAHSQVSWSPQDFYEAAHTPKPNSSDANFAAAEIPNLEATLFPFQQRAVQWLLRREGVEWSGDLQEDGQPLIQPSGSRDASHLPALFHAVKNTNGDIFHISPVFGITVKDMAKLQPNDTINGGILAEEMGNALPGDKC